MTTGPARHYPYLIAGGGMAADAAARGIRQVDPDGPIGLIGQEPDPPYNRPPLSKGLWKGGPRPMPLSRVFRGTANLGVDLHLGRRVTALDPAQKQVTDDLGQVYRFDKLLLALGGEPVRLGPDHPRVIYYHTLADYHHLRALIDIAQTFAVIGGGFIGSEMAAVLAGQGKTVTLVFPGGAPLDRVLPAPLTGRLTATYTARGVRLLPGRRVTALLPDDAGVTVRLDSGETLRVEAVVAGLGIRPNTALAAAAGLAVGDGIQVDPALRTSHPDIYAAGDAAEWFSPSLGRRVRMEHEENANLTGLLAGQGMAGQPGQYAALPSVYSTLFGDHFDAVGDLNPALETVYAWDEPLARGTITYRAAGRARGVILWNLNGGLDEARRLIEEGV